MCPKNKPQVKNSSLINCEINRLNLRAALLLKTPGDSSQISNRYVQWQTFQVLLTLHKLVTQIEFIIKVFSRQEMSKTCHKGNQKIYF